MCVCVCVCVLIHSMHCKPSNKETCLKLLTIMAASTQPCGCDNRTVEKQHGRGTEREKRKLL